MHDLVIRNGKVIDGSGKPGRRADVAIDGDRIVAVGEVTEPGRREIDADGKAVTPGWVDVHTHYDGQATWDPEVSPSGWHGVTTVVMGNCGVGFAPVRKGEQDFLIQLMEGVEDIPGAALEEGMTWNWESFPEYLDELERMPRVMDVAALLPHGALRTYVLGSERPNDEANEGEIAEMARLAHEAALAGAMGVSTTRTLLHRAKDGELAAGTTAAARELIEIGSALGDTGHRVFSIASDMMDPAAEFDWMTEISQRAGIPVTFQVLAVDFAPHWWRDWINRALNANREGAWLVPQVAGKPASVLVGFESNFHPFVRNSEYLKYESLPMDERIKVLRDPAVRDAILAARPTGALAGFDALMASSLDKLFPLGDPPNYEPDPSTSIAAVAEREGRDPLEVTYDMMLQRDGRELLYLPLLGYVDGSLNDIGEMLKHPGTVLGLGDGGAHCGVLCDASLPTFMLTHWARDRSRGETLPVEMIVNHQTRRTAMLYGFADRGLLAPGYLADINVVDLDELALLPPEMAYDLPAGGKRLIQRATGYVATIKSGVVVREGDVATGELPGRLLRGAQADPAAERRAEPMLA